MRLWGVKSKSRQNVVKIEAWRGGGPHFYPNKTCVGSSRLKAEHLLTLPNERLELLEQKVSRV